VRSETLAEAKAGVQTAHVDRSRSKINKAPVKQTSLDEATNRSTRAS
jgi:hypothetical protein